MELLPFIYDSTEIIEKEETDNGINVLLRLRDASQGNFEYKYKDYFIK